jgi:hypothetical protein
VDNRAGVDTVNKGKAYYPYQESRISQSTSGPVTMLTELSLIPGSFPFSDISTDWQFRDYSLAYSLVTFLNMNSSFFYLKISYKDIAAIKLQRKEHSWCRSPDITMLLRGLEKIPGLKTRNTWDVKLAPLHTLKVL